MNTLALPKDVVAEDAVSSYFTALALPNVELGGLMVAAAEYDDFLYPSYDQTPTSQIIDQALSMRESVHDYELYSIKDLTLRRMKFLTMRQVMLDVVCEEVVSFNMVRPLAQQMVRATCEIDLTHRLAGNRRSAIRQQFNPLTSAGDPTRRARSKEVLAAVPGITRQKIADYLIDGYSHGRIHPAQG